jgi:hypothetical protein
MAFGQSYVLLQSEIGCRDSIPLCDAHLSLRVDTVDMQFGLLVWELDVSVLCGAIPGLDIQNTTIRNDGFPIYLDERNKIQFLCKCGYGLYKLFPLRVGFYRESLLDLVRAQTQPLWRESQFRVIGKYFDPTKKEVVNGMFEVKVKAVIDPKDIDALDFDRLW